MIPIILTGLSSSWRVIWPQLVPCRCVSTLSCHCLQVIDENSSTSIAFCNPSYGAPTPQAQSWLTAFMPIADILFPVIWTAMSTCCKPLKSPFIVKFCSWLLHFTEREEIVEVQIFRASCIWGQRFFTVKWVDRPVSWFLKISYIPVAGERVGDR